MCVIVLLLQWPHEAIYCGLAQGKGATICLINQLPLVYFSEFAVILNLFH